MALKKAVTKIHDNTSDIGKNDARAKREADDQRRKARTLAKQQQAAERIASASVELATGVTQAASARDQLSTAVSEIATGAEQAAGASQESLAAVNQITSNVERQLRVSELSSNKTTELQQTLNHVGSEIGSLVNGVTVASKKQTASSEMMQALEAQADNINDAVKQVMRIADQTNLLALNAAIEAGRAGKHGKGFAVVADTVRALAETAERNAADIGKQIETIQDKSKEIGSAVRESAKTALSEVDKAQAIIQQLSVIKDDMGIIYDGSIALRKAGEEMNEAAAELQKGSEMIASAAEEQSSAAEQVASALDEQGQALMGAEQASQGLEINADELKTSTDIAKSSEEVAANAEELSATVEEVNRSATEIMTAVGQISRGAEQAATAVEQAVAGIAQLEKSVEFTDGRASEALDIGEKIAELLNTNKEGVDQLIAGISDSLESSRSNLVAIDEVETITRQIDKVTDAIATVAIKTSMLAVNGAVEAARAGEFGKGFAVVSSDIQSLADDAAENVDQIKEMIKAIQDHAAKVRADLSEVASNAVEQVDRANQTTENLVTIESEMNDVVTGNEEIKGAVSEISSAVIQAKKGMEQIATAAEQSSSNAQEAGTAARQQSQAAEELAIAIEEIASIADELQSA